MREDLVERVARAIVKAEGGADETVDANWVLWTAEARAAIRVALEDAAKVANGFVCEWHNDLADGCARDIAKAIRALIPKE